MYFIFDHAMKAAIKGKPLTAIAAFTEVPGVQILVSTPVGAEALAAVLENDRVHGMMAAGLLGARLVETGRAFVLVDLRSRAAAERLFGGPYLESGLLTRPEVCAERPETCVKLARALVKATKWLSARGSAEVAPSLPRTLVQDPRLYTAALEENRDGFSRTARIDPRAVETVTAAYRASGAMSPTPAVDPTVLYDNRFVDQASATIR